MSWRTKYDKKRKRIIRKNQNVKKLLGIQRLQEERDHFSVHDVNKLEENDILLSLQ